MYIVSHLVYSVHFTLHCVAVTIGGSGQLSVSALVAGAQDHDQVQDHPIIYFPAQHDEERHHDYHVFPRNEEEINSQSLEDTQVGYTSHQTASTQYTLFSCIHLLLVPKSQNPSATVQIERKNEGKNIVEVTDGGADESSSELPYGQRYI